MKRELINDEALEGVVGGHMHWNENTKTMTYTHEETGEVTQYRCVKYNRAWQMSNHYHSQSMHEDDILEMMLNDGCIEPM